MAAKGFSELGEPLAGLLEVLEGCPGSQKGKSSTLGQFILGEFLRWRPQKPQASLIRVPAELVPGLQRQALGLICDSRPGYMEPLLEIYQLGSLERGVLLKHVGYLWDCCSYREVREGREEGV